MMRPGDTSAAPESVRPLLVVVAASTLLGVYYLFRTSVWFEGTRVFLLWDDAMISMQYAKNLAEGHGLVWSAGGERVQGFTNLGVTLLMAAIHSLPLETGQPALVLQALNLAALAALVAIAYRIFSLSFGGDRASSLVAAIGVAFCFPLQIYAVQGSDTGFVCLWLLACHLLLVRSTAGRGGWPRGLFGLLASGLLLRPDAAVWLAPFGVVFLTMAGSKHRGLIEAATSYAIVGGGLLVFGWLYYGDPLPNTYYLKATGQPRSLMLANGSLQLMWWAAHWLPLLVLDAFAVRRYWALPFVRVAVGCIAVSCAYHVWVGGDIQPYYGSRFLIPILPLLLCLGAAGAMHLFEDAIRIGSPGARRMAGIAATLLAFAVANAWLPTREMLSNSRDTMLKPYNEQNLTSALFYRAYTRPRTTIGLHWAGVIAYYSDRPVVDVLGKSDRHIARLHVNRFAPGHSKWDWDYVIHTLAPDIMNDASRGLLERPDFRKLYIRAEPPGFAAFYIRKDKLQKLRYEGTRLSKL